MIEYLKNASSGVAKAALATGITGAALGVLNGGASVIGNMFGRPYGAPVQFSDGGFAGHGFATERELHLTRELSEKDSIIAMQGAEKYTDGIAASLANRICALETATAVNAARDQDFRRYVEREFIHQPKASIHDSIVVCKQCGCECETE